MQLKLAFIKKDRSKAALKIVSSGKSCYIFRNFISLAEKKQERKNLKEFSKMSTFMFRKKVNLHNKTNSNDNLKYRNTFIFRKNFLRRKSALSKTNKSTKEFNKEFNKESTKESTKEFYV